MASFSKPEACGQTVLPDRSVSIRQKLVGNAKIQKFKCDILSCANVNFESYRKGRILKMTLLAFKTLFEDLGEGVLGFADDKVEFL